jgi:hypothetical protein
MDETIMSIRERVSRPTYEKFGEPEPIEPLFSNAQTHSLEAWRLLREQVDNRWQRVLGMPSFGGYDPTPSLLYTFDQPAYRATVYQQPTGPSTRQTLLLMEPNRPLPAPLPGMVIPFYTPDRMVGLDISTREPLVGESPLIQFARHLAEQGYLVVCTEAFPYNTVSEPEENVGFAWWQKGAEKLLLDHPDWTGMGKLVYDTRRALDLLLAQPTVDPSRVGVMGHSLGGKMSFYAGCLDERFHAVISSDFGMGWSFTNWDAPWYLGKQIKEPGFTLAHHHLLALAAPRPFLLFGGEADRPATWQYLEEARKVYSLYGQSSAIGFFDHGAGHRPTEESLEVAYGWLAEHFGVNPNPWSL